MAKREKRKASVGIALLPVFFVVIFLMFAVLDIEKYVGWVNVTCEPHMPLFFGAMFAAAIAIYVLGYTWEELEERMIETIKMSMGANLILLVIGMLIGTWIVSGIVPAMIFYGLDILNPSFFLVAALVICSVVSTATGTSWGTAGTVGIALMGIGSGLGIDPAITGGAVVSGAYFGDKMSPLSDTTNLAPAMAGATLYDHIKHMLYTSIPAYLLALTLFALIGFQYGSNNLDVSQINALQDGLSGSFNSMSPILLLGPVLVIAMVVLKAPALPGLFMGTIVGAVFAIVIQGADLNVVINSFHYGYVSETGNVIIDKLLTRGGMSSMLWTINLILTAMCFGGVMEKSGMLGVLAETILKGARGVGGLVVATALSCISINFITGNQYLSLVIPGRMYRKAYDEAGLAPKNLSRVLEDVGTVTSPLIPWNTCGATMIGTLGLAPWLYVPYCFFNIFSPIVSIVYGYTGFTMTRIVRKDVEAPIDQPREIPKATPVKPKPQPIVPPPELEPATPPIAQAVQTTVQPPETPVEPIPAAIPIFITDPEPLPVPAPAIQRTELSLNVLGKSVALKDAPIIKTADDVIMLPLISLGQALGYAITNDDSASEIVLIKNDKSIIVNKNNRDYSWENEPRTFTVKPEEFFNQIYVPTDFITSNPGLTLKQTETSITINGPTAATTQSTTAKIMAITLFSNGLQLNVANSENAQLILYVTEKTRIRNLMSNAVLERSELKIGTNAVFTYAVVVGQEQKVFNVLSSVDVHEQAALPIMDIGDSAM